MLEKPQILIYNTYINQMEVWELAYTISDECVSCGACAPECPLDCISEGDSKFVINAETCISCGACAGACPTDAILEG